MASGHVKTTSNFPGFSDKAYPELFNLSAKPAPPKEKKPGQLSESAIRQFFENGYVIVESFFKHEELEACKRDIDELVEDLAQKLFKAGKIKDLHRECGTFERLTLIEKDFPGANIVLLKMGRLPKAFQELWSNERLLNVVEQLIGPNIAGHPVWNIRTKTPQNEATTVPWHQDVGYLDNDSYKVIQPTAWIPFIDANQQNGCMEVVHQGHKTGKVATHQCCHGGTWYVMLEEEEMCKSLDVNIETDVKLCPVPYGGMLLINNLIPHRSLPNLSNQIRWSVDLRWQRPDLPFGFYGLKEGIPMRYGNDPNYVIDWEPFNAVSRDEKQRESVKDILEPSSDKDFDTTIQGPWMKKWKIVHVNRHNEGVMEESAKSIS